MAGDTGAPGFIPLYDDDTSFAPIQNPLNGISQALNAALTAIQRLTTSKVADQAARDALFPAPVQGDRVYRKDLGFTQVYRDTFNAVTNPAGAQVAGWKTDGGGLVPVIPASVAGSGVTLGPRGLVSFSAATTVSVNGVFTPDHDNYVAIPDNYAASTPSGGTIRLRASGVDEPGNNYSTQVGWDTGTTPQATSTSLVGNWGTTPVTGVEYSGSWVFFGPALPRATRAKIDAEVVSTPSSLVSVRISARHNLSASYDGFTFAPTAGNVTGGFRIYGYSN